MFETFQNRLKITGKICAQTALHIGAAEQEFAPGGARNPFLRNALGFPFIPGASLKGVMRSFMEQLFAEREQGAKLAGVDTEAWVSVCTISEQCIDKSSKKKNEKSEMFSKLLEKYGNTHDGDDEKAYVKFIEDNTCMVCHLFGSQVNGAKLLVRDAIVYEDSYNGDFELRTGVSIDRELGRAVQGRFYDFEVVPQGTEFQFCMVAENLNDNEWQCLRVLLRAMGMGFLSVGGMTSRGLGSFTLEDVKIQLLDKNNLVNTLLCEQEPEPVTLDNFVILGGLQDES